MPFARPLRAGCRSFTPPPPPGERRPGRRTSLAVARSSSAMKAGVAPRGVARGPAGSHSDDVGGVTQRRDGGGHPALRGATPTGETPVSLFDTSPVPSGPIPRSPFGPTGCALKPWRSSSDSSTS